MPSTKEKIIVVAGNKWTPWVLIVVFVVATFFAWKYHVSQINDEHATYKRQVEGKLTEKERELQVINLNLGLAESKLLKQNDLVNQYEKDIKEKDKVFEKFKKKHDLEIRNYEIVIAGLKQKIKGGTTTVIVKEGSCPNGDDNEEDQAVISYKYEEEHKRVVLVDPDIFTKDNEELTLDQKFKVQGEVWEQKDGSLQTKRVKLFEVVARQRADGTIEYDSIAEAALIDISFNYSNEPNDIERSWTEKHLDYLQPIVGMGEQLHPGFNTLGSLGVEWINFKDIGIGLTTMININTTEVDNSGASVGFSYHIPKTNLGLNAYVGTPFREFFQRAYVGVELVFYIMDW